MPRGAFLLARWLRDNEESGSQEVVEFKAKAPAPERRGEEIFSETARKLPVQLNRKQYENLFESFDYTKEATRRGDVGGRVGRQRGYGHIS